MSYLPDPYQIVLEQVLTDPFEKRIIYELGKTKEYYYRKYEDDRFYAFHYAVYEDWRKMDGGWTKFKRHVIYDYRINQYMVSETEEENRKRREKERERDRRRMRDSTKKREETKRRSAKSPWESVPEISEPESDVANEEPSQIKLLTYPVQQESKKAWEKKHGKNPADKYSSLKTSETPETKQWKKEYKQDNDTQKRENAAPYALKVDKSKFSMGGTLEDVKAAKETGKNESQRRREEESVKDDGRSSRRQGRSDKKSRAAAQEDSYYPEPRRQYPTGMSDRVSESGDESVAFVDLSDKRHREDRSRRVYNEDDFRVKSQHSEHLGHRDRGVDPRGRDAEKHTSGQRHRSSSRNPDSGQPRKERPSKAGPPLSNTKFFENPSPSGSEHRRSKSRTPESDRDPIPKTRRPSVSIHDPLKERVRTTRTTTTSYPDASSTYNNMEGIRDPGYIKRDRTRQDPIPTNSHRDPNPFAPRGSYPAAQTHTLPTRPHHNSRHGPPPPPHPRYPSYDEY